LSLSEAACPAGGERRLTAGEIALTHGIFGKAINCSAVRIRRRRWFPLQPRGTVMAPLGHLHFPADCPHYRDDFSSAPLVLQGLFLHEMTHVWQTQRHGWWYLPLVRSFSSRYDYTLKPGWPLARYGIEQQAEIVRHAFLLRRGMKLAGVAGAQAYDFLVDFPEASRRDGF
jgi:hypothetical protein